MIVGLVAKNAILIVEFAEAERKKGGTLVAASGRREASLPANLDDIARFHCRMRAISFRFGLRSGGSSSDGNSRNRWNARSMSDRNLLHSSGLLPGGRAGRVRPQPHQDSLAGQIAQSGWSGWEERELAEPACPLSSLIVQSWQSSSRW